MRKQRSIFTTKYGARRSSPLSRERQLAHAEHFCYSQSLGGFPLFLVNHHHEWPP